MVRWLRAKLFDLLNLEDLHLQQLQLEMRVNALTDRIGELEQLGAPEPPPQGIIEPGKVDFNAWTGD